MAEQRDASDGFLVGRDTFIAMRDYWSPQTDDTTGVTTHLNSVRKYVVSSTLESPEWDDTEVLTGTLEDEIRRIKAADGSDLVCTGGIRLSRELLSLGLVDEVRLFMYPFARGSGQRLFDGTPPAWLQLAECRRFARGPCCSATASDSGPVEDRPRVTGVEVC